MVTVVQLRTKLVNLLEDYKKLKHEDECKDEKLIKIRVERQKFETIRAKTYSELDAAERKKEEIERSIQENLKKIAELQKSTVECQRTTEALTQKLENQDTIFMKLQESADNAQSQASVTAKTYAETLDRLQDLQVLQDKAEKREEKLICNIKELEHEKAALGNKLRATKSLDGQAEARLNSLEESITSLTNALTTANERARDAENTYEELSVVLAALEEEANDWRMKSEKMQEQLELMRSGMTSS